MALPIVNVTRALALSSLLAVAAACGPAVQNITVQTPAAIAAAPDQATIVVAQPTTRYQVNILNERGELLAQLNDRSHTVLQVPAGQVRLYAVWENQSSSTDRIEGTVEAGRTYYATISMRWGGLSFLALNTRSPDARWSQKDQYIGGTPRLQMDPNKVSLAKTEIGDTAPMIAAADEYIGKLDAAHLAEHLIRAEDGQ